MLRCPYNMSNDSGTGLDFETLDRYLAGESSKEEMRVVGAIIASRPGFNRELRVLSEELASSSMVQTAPRASAASFERLRAKHPDLAAGNDSPTVGRGYKGKRISQSMLHTSIGMAVLVVATVGLGVKYKDYFEAQLLPSVSAESAKTYSTGRAQRATVKLADGSEVILAPSTTIRSVGTSGREVYIDGQAVFNVSQSKGEAFTIVTGNTTVKVLGTTFGVRHYRQDEATSVTVAVGKVVAGGAILSAGDKATVKNNGATDVVHGIDIRSDLGWTSGNLSLNASTLRSVIPELERWYGVTISASNSLLDRPIRAELQIDAQDEAMEVLAFVLRARVSRSGNTVTFTSNR